MSSSSLWTQTAILEVALKVGKSIARRMLQLDEYHESSAEVAGLVALPGIEPGFED
jgi:hypothetical protein